MLIYRKLILPVISTRMITEPYLKEHKTGYDIAWIYWKGIQQLCWVAGFALLITLFINPGLGITLFWNGLIPLAPAILVLAPGIWRNICPLGTTSLLADRFGVAGKLKLSPVDQAKLHLAGVLILFLIIPMRHILFNTDGIATGLILLMLGAAAFGSGLFFTRKSGWCSGICPVHPVEKLYGSNPSASMINAHCADCIRCSVPCPDSTPVSKPFLQGQQFTAFLLVGAFPGYIWGWFQTPDYTGNEGWAHIGTIYGWPAIGGLVTGLLFLLLRKLFPAKENRIIRAFAASAVSCYYWFRLPLLFGFDQQDTHSRLLDLHQSIPHWVITLFALLLITFFCWWILIRNNRKNSWSVRPALTGK